MWDCRKIAADGDADDDTYNFQKASCTLDASIKIYSYRVDDTWNSSYKILENLSRTEQKHGVEEAASDDEGAATTARKTRKTHARTIEKNLNNINLKAYDTECEADPLFHKMSQSFDEGGAKGMLLANLSVYDGCKILLNSSDVSVVTRKPIHDVPVKSQTDEAENQVTEKPEKSDDAKPNEVSAEAETVDGKEKNNESAKADTEGEEGQKDSEADVESKDTSVTETEEGECEKKDAEKENVGATEDAPAAEKEGSGDDVVMEEKERNKEEEQEKEGSTEDANNENHGNDKANSSGDTTTEEEQSKESDSSDAAGTTNEGKSPAKPPAVKERISLSLFSSLSCIDQDVQNLSVCPPLYRMYDQLDEFYGDESRHKLGIKNDFLLTTPVKGRRKTLDKQDAITMNLAGIMEEASEDESDGGDAEQEAPIDFGDDNADYDADEDGADTAGETKEAADGDPADEVDADMEKEKEKEIIDLAGSDDEDNMHEDLTQDGAENGPKPLDKESSLTSTAADFFRAKVNENLPDNYENNLFSQMIESALVRSATMEDEQGEDPEGKNDYSYFDVKMLRNWAGPGHWKFPGVRKTQTKKEEVEKDGLSGLNGEIDDEGVVIKAEPSERPSERIRKGSTAGAEKKAAVLIDFFGEEPDLARLKAPKSASTLEITKGNLKKQLENAADLVLPVDTHIELGLFFRHFLKERPRFFRKRGSGCLDGAHREGASTNNFEYGDTSADAVDDNNHEQPFTYNEDSAGFEGEYDDEDEGTSGADDPSAEALYSVEGLVQADRVVEKIGVHYERLAKRVDVKKLKGSIWDHLEKKVVKSVEKKNAISGADSTSNSNQASEADQSDVSTTINESGKRPREPEADEQNEGGDTEALDTTFENVVENVAGKVRHALYSCLCIRWLTVLL
ncbi:unnamed protein product [Phytophthora lilii]|uniref:Condensin complex subunit 2 n=1 Tax=Phytophthora lilii TaxID=2077276 RepID=A0A9W6WYJ8_9STRA|nr:unnamed protein product [Phytophthora lilii]